MWGGKWPREINSMSSSLLKFFISIVFIFSTIYTLQFYYFEGEDTPENIYSIGLEETDGTSRSMGPVNNVTAVDALRYYLSLGMMGEKPDLKEDILDDLIDPILEALSWASPFALLKGLLTFMMPAQLYEPFNLLILRPVGWIGTWISTEWLINKLRGSSES